MRLRHDVATTYWANSTTEISRKNAQRQQSPRPRIVDFVDAHRGRIAPDPEVHAGFAVSSRCGHMMTYVDTTNSASLRWTRLLRRACRSCSKINGSWPKLFLLSVLHHKADDTAHDVVPSPSPRAIPRLFETRECSKCLEGSALSSAVADRNAQPTRIYCSSPKQRHPWTRTSPSQPCSYATCAVPKLVV